MGSIETVLREVSIQPVCSRGAVHHYRMDRVVIVGLIEHNNTIDSKPHLDVGIGTSGNPKAAATGLTVSAGRKAGCKITGLGK